LPIQKLSPNFEAPVGVEANAYQYNGIERVEDFGLEVSHAQFRTLDAQTGRWWQIDPMAEKFYAWSPYNSNLNNPIRYNDPKGDTPWGIIAGAAIGAGVEYGFQVAENYYDGKRGSEMFKMRNGNAILISAGSGAATSGLNTVNKISSRMLAFTANRLVDGVVSTAESAAKQAVEVKDGERESISVSESVRDGVISTVVGGLGESGEKMAKEYLKNEFNNVTKGVLGVTTEIQENSYQKIATATVGENSTPKNQHMASLPSAQPTQKPAAMPASGNRMANPQPILQPDIF